MKRILLSRAYHTPIHSKEVRVNIDLIETYELITSEGSTVSEVSVGNKILRVNQTPSQIDNLIDAALTWYNDSY